MRAKNIFSPERDSDNNANPNLPNLGATSKEADTSDYQDIRISSFNSPFNLRKRTAYFSHVINKSLQIRIEIRLKINLAQRGDLSRVFSLSLSLSLLTTFKDLQLMGVAGDWV